MTCVLRAGGATFDVHAWRAAHPDMADSWWVAGERRFPESRRITTINDTSGVRIVASDPDFDALDRQIDETIAFLAAHRDVVAALVAWPGVDGAALDFGVETRPPGWASFAFPPALLKLAGELGLALTVSVYPVDDEGDADASAPDA